MYQKGMQVRHHKIMTLNSIIRQKEWKSPKQVIVSKIDIVSPGLTLPSVGRSQHYNQSPSDTNELAKYLLKSQLLTSELSKFDDKPENYLCWKSSFLNATKTLNFNEAEEVDLLIKSLGPESSKHAKRIKAVNINKPYMAVDLIWERLEQEYGSPEAIEGALFTKLEQFPKIGNRDNRKLRELSDLLLEIHSAKEEGYLHGLSYLDTARGVAPIVDKLPFGLQDKWMMEGSRYKQQNKVTFPHLDSFLNSLKHKQGHVTTQALIYTHWVLLELTETDTQSVKISDRRLCQCIKPMLLLDLLKDRTSTVHCITHHTPCSSVEVSGRNLSKNER